MASDETDLVLRWVRAWTHVRGLATTSIDGWPFVAVGAASRGTELICVDPGPARLDRLLTHVAGDPRAMLTVFADPIQRYRDRPLAPGVRVDRDDETFMTAVLPPPVHSPVPDGYAERWIEDGRRSRLLLERDGSVAAEGTVGILGGDAVIDAVETVAAHRRRGLAHHVVVRLMARAAAEGATTGLLVASSDGRPLYAGLGWHATLPAWSVMGTS